MAMYGKRRVVLSTRMTRSGKQIVSISGGKSYIPLGFWYESGGRYYADLMSNDQLYQLVANDDIAYQGIGDCESKKALREFVMDYYNNMRS